MSIFFSFTILIASNNDWFNYLPSTYREWERVNIGSLENRNQHRSPSDYSFNNRLIQQSPITILRSSFLNCNNDAAVYIQCIIRAVALRADIRSRTRHGEYWSQPVEYPPIVVSRFHLQSHTKFDTGCPSQHHSRPLPRRHPRARVNNGISITLSIGVQGKPKIHLSRSTPVRRHAASIIHHYLIMIA